jgi:transposase-like protein
MSKVSDDVEASIVADYLSDVPVQKIMDTYGIAEGALYRTLRRAGHEPGRPFNGRRPKKWTPAELDRIRDRRLAGATVSALRREFGAGKDRVTRALEQLGLADVPPK